MLSQINNQQKSIDLKCQKVIENFEKFCKANDIEYKLPYLPLLQLAQWCNNNYLMNENIYAKNYKYLESVDLKKYSIHIDYLNCDEDNLIFYLFSDKYDCDNNPFIRIEDDIEIFKYEYYNANVTSINSIQDIKNILRKHILETDILFLMIIN